MIRSLHSGQVSSRHPAERRFLAAVAVAAMLLPACSWLLKPPELVLDRVELSGVSLGGATLTARMRVGNPNFYGITTQRITYELFVEGKPAGHDVVEREFTVPAGGVSTLEIPAKVGWSAALGGLGQGLEKGTVNSEVRGVVTLKSILGPVDFPYTVQLQVGEPAPPDR